MQRNLLAFTKLLPHGYEHFFFQNVFSNSALSYFPSLCPRDQFGSLFTLQRNLYFYSLQLSFGI